MNSNLLIQAQEEVMQPKLQFLSLQDDYDEDIEEA